MNTIQGNLIAQDRKFALVASRFNSFIVEHLISGAKDTLLRHGVSEKDMDLVYVPGAFEIPFAAKAIAKTKKYDAIITLGAVIRGATPHFDYVCSSCTKGIAQISLDFDIPIAFGVLTVDTIEQAIERAGTKAGNKGVDAAISAIEMVDLVNSL